MSTATQHSAAPTRGLPPRLIPPTPPSNIAVESASSAGVFTPAPTQGVDLWTNEPDVDLHELLADRLRSLTLDPADYLAIVVGLPSDWQPCTISVRVRGFDVDCRPHPAEPGVWVFECQLIPR